MKTVVITKQPAVVDFLREIGFIDETAVILEYASVSDVSGHHVLGNVPFWLGSFAAMVTEIPLDVPSELRSSRLTLDQVRRYIGELVTYSVRRI